MACGKPQCVEKLQLKEEGLTLHQCQASSSDFRSLVKGLAAEGGLRVSWRREPAVSSEPVRPHMSAPPLVV